jgi:lipoyl(octanoyl) transferase
MSITICKIGTLSYGDALELQYRLVDARQKDQVGDTLLLLEHPHVLTKGTRADAANIYLSEQQLKKLGIGIYEVNRGGDVTYHGPGQIVAYPVFQLKNYEKGIRWFIQTMEASLIDLLQDEFQLHAHSRTDNYTGVWVNEKKIAAFGLAVMHGVTMHGFAFNVNTDLAYFHYINPCGLGLGVTSVANELGHEADMNATFDRTGASFAEHFGIHPVWISPEELLRRLEMLKTEGVQAATGNQQQGNCTE